MARDILEHRLELALFGLAGPLELCTGLGKFTQACKGECGDERRTRGMDVELMGSLALSLGEGSLWGIYRFPPGRRSVENLL